jgi:hypothetical protein
MKYLVFVLALAAGEAYGQGIGTTYNFPGGRTTYFSAPNGQSATATTYYNRGGATTYFSPVTPSRPVRKEVAPALVPNNGRFFAPRWDYPMSPELRAWEIETVRMLNNRIMYGYGY